MPLEAHGHARMLHSVPCMTPPDCTDTDSNAVHAANPATTSDCYSTRLHGQTDSNDTRAGGVSLGFWKRLQKHADMHLSYT
jgi:hypothetical protein